MANSYDGPGPQLTQWQNGNNLAPVHLDLENDLISSLSFFSKNAKKIASGGLIMSLEKFGLIWYFNFLQTVFMYLVKS